MDNLEKAWIEKAQSGDFSAFRNLVERHQRKIYYLAYDFTGNHEDAEDVVQDVLVKAFHGLSQFRGDAKLGSWLHRITLNLCLDRKGKYCPVTTPVDEQGPHLPADPHPHQNPERVTASHRIGKAIERALEILTPLERAIFLLRHYHQMTGRETATMLERSEGTIKNILFRAIRKLQKELAPLEAEVGMEERL